MKPRTEIRDQKSEIRNLASALCFFLLSLSAQAQTHHLFIVPASDKPAINQRAKTTFDKAGGDRTVRVPLFAADAPDDSTPLYYWFCIAEGALKNPADKDALLELKTLFATAKHWAVDLDKDPTAAVALRASLGLRTALPLIEVKDEAKKDAAEEARKKPTP